MWKRRKKIICVVLALHLILLNQAHGLAADNLRWYLEEIGLPKEDEADSPENGGNDLEAETDSEKNGGNDRTTDSQGTEGSSEETDTREVVIAVIDTGAEITHSGLKDSLWVNELEKNGEEGIDDDGNGYVDDIYGYNIKGKNGDVNDTDGHGTHVAGLAGQQGARIMVVKAANTSGGFSSENLVKAVNYASQNGADVINMSVGTTYCTDELRKAIEEAAQRAVVVAAAGNSGKPTAESGYDDSENMFPAGLSTVLGVMSYDEAGELAWFSNWDYEADSEVDYEIIAPGENIYSTTLNGKYKMESGTSMSTAIVSAICGRVIEQWRSCGDAVAYDPELVKKCIVSGAKEVVTYTDQDGRIHQFPKVNLEGALAWLQENCTDNGTEQENTENPENTVSPENTGIPESSGKPQGTGSPENIGDPESTKSPGNMGNPEATASPGITASPETTGSPEGSTHPGDTESPEITENPGSSENPESSRSPEGIVPPESTVSPENSGNAKSPGVTGSPERTVAPGGTGNLQDSGSSEEGKNRSKDISAALPKKGTLLKDKKGRIYKVLTVNEKKGSGTVAIAGMTDRNKKEVVIPKAVSIDGVSWTVTSIADKAFSGCSELKRAVIGKKVTVIGKKAFYRCTGLKKIIIPSAVKKIGAKAFYGCKQLSEITVRTRELSASSVGKQAFTGISRKAKVKVPAKSYKKIFYKRGIISSLNALFVVR